MRLAPCLALLALLAACSKGATTAGGSTGATSGAGSSGGSGSTGSSGSTGGPTALQRCQQLAQAACQHDVACGFVAAADEGACERAAGCDSPALALADARAAAGTVSYAAAALAACAADLAAAPCGLTGADARRASANCQAIATGSTPPGGACQVGGECAGDAVCQRQLDACGGSCPADLTQGACGPGLPPPAPGSFCADDGGVSPQGGAGAPCEADRACLPGLGCVGPRGARTCQSPTALDAGSPCQGPHECYGGGNCLGARADGGPGVCEPRFGPGAACRLDLPDGGFAHFPDGGARPRDELCQGGLYCDPETVTCAHRALPGDACAPDGGRPDCLLGACVGGTCAYLADGAPCQAGGDCQSGACVRPTDGGEGACALGCP